MASHASRSNLKKKRLARIRLGIVGQPPPKHRPMGTPGSRGRLTQAFASLGKRPVGSVG